MCLCSMKSKDSGVAGAVVEVRVGGNKGKEMTGQIPQGLVGSGEDFTFALNEVEPWRVLDKGST